MSTVKPIHNTMNKVYKQHGDCFYNPYNFDRRELKIYAWSRRSIGNIVAVSGPPEKLSNQIFTSLIRHSDMLDNFSSLLSFPLACLKAIVIASVKKFLPLMVVLHWQGYFANRICSLPHLVQNLEHENLVNTKIYLSNGCNSKFFLYCD